MRYRALALSCIVLTLALFVSGPSFSNETESVPHDQKAKTKDESAPTWPPTASPDRGIGAEKSLPAPSADKDSRQYQEQAKKNLFSPSWVMVYLTAVYVIVATLSLLAIRRQLGIARASAEAAAQSANAAGVTAEMLCATERPWVIESLDQEIFSRVGNMGEQAIPLTITFRNHGRTPAWVTGIATMRKIDNVDGLPKTPEYRPDLAERDIGEVVLAPNVESSFLQTVLFVNGAEFSQVRMRRLFLYVWGFVNYRDGRGDPHESRFCYRFHVQHPEDPRPTAFYPYSKQEYVRNT